MEATKGDHIESTKPRDPARVGLEGRQKNGGIVKQQDKRL